ncbi:expressed unknown protein [Seminavis robusta]|uniref:Uncharacterized protein n=1 Tax=Seminavis robusta TaxID=568900 RepID=A0A9N8EUI9_9STRA|nr:expressed unknown protein [Seminavis robusta]|eukprot:Sro1611_g285930.1 n/a (265) ;mRNA; r:19755-20549
MTCIEQHEVCTPPPMPERCELGNLHYGDDEINDCGCGSHRSSSMTELDATTNDFWNMTLDDLDSLPTSPSMRSSTSDLPDTTPRRAAATRRNSDGMVMTGSCSFGALRRKKKVLPSRNVSFGSVEVRECERVLGDNPSCHDGPSLSIGWKYEAKAVIDVEIFENKRQKERRTYDKLCLSPEKREKIAKRSGYTKKDIEDNVKQMAKYNRRRERTRKELEVDSFAAKLPKSQRDSLAKFLQKQGTKAGKASTGTRSSRSLSLRSL